ncbi:hypothetical protein V1514DRAFT_332079 [Lipomyces japonicus]|uniref:uncharacterized protein n=1 Tax=Lipomyces japonicus TaxID=56871 RepID=UPI0034CFE1F2
MTLTSNQPGLHLPARTIRSNPNVVAHSILTPARSLAWLTTPDSSSSSSFLAYGDDLGITITALFTANPLSSLRHVAHIHVGVATTAIRLLASPWSSSILHVVSAHADFSIRTHHVLLDHEGPGTKQFIGSTTQAAVLTGTSGHSAPVVALAAGFSSLRTGRPTILIASASDDKTLILSAVSADETNDGVSVGTENEIPPQTVPLSASVSSLRFVPGRDQVVVLEQVNSPLQSSRVRILDIGTGKWNLSLYNSNINEITFSETTKNLYCIQAGRNSRWKSYSGIARQESTTRSLFAAASSEGQLRTQNELSSVQSKETIAVNGNAVVKVTSNSVTMFDLEAGTDSGRQTVVVFPTKQPNVVAVRREGDAVAVAVGTEVFVVNVAFYGNDDEGRYDVDEESVVYYNH